MSFSDHASGLKRWGPYMVSDVDIVYKSNVPVFPELVLSISPGRLLPELEYDFVYERQAVADHDEYLKLKRLSEQQQQQLKSSAPTTEATANTSTTTTTTTIAGEHLSNHSSAAVTVTAPTGCAVSGTVSTSSLPASPLQQTVPTITTSIVSNVSQSSSMSAMVRTPLQPVTTLHMPPDNVLQPQKTGRHHSGGHLEANSIHGLPSAYPSVAEHGKPAASNYLNEFEVNSDDPFASVELKAINEIEELRAVLQPSPVPSYQNITRFTAPTAMQTSSYQSQPYPAHYSSNSGCFISRMPVAPLPQTFQPIRPPTSYSFYARPTFQSTTPAANSLTRQPSSTSVYNAQMLDVPSSMGSLSISAPDLKNLKFRHRSPI